MQHVYMPTSGVYSNPIQLLVTVSISPLSETRQKGDRRRERWLAELASCSLLEAWTPERVAVEVRNRVNSGVAVGHLKADRSINTTIHEGCLAGHPDVRSHFHRLIQMRDRIWAAHSDLVRSIVHGPSQLLVDMCVAQKKQHLRHYLSSDAAYVQHLQNRLADRMAGRRRQRRR